MPEKSVIFLSIKHAVLGSSFSMKKNLGHRVEEFILLVLILLNIFEFLNLLSGESMYLEKIISWTSLGYLLYRASLTKVFFGKRNRLLDFTLIIAFFMMTFKNFIALVAESRGEELLFRGFYELIYNNGPLIQYVSFTIGGALLLVIALWITLRTEIHKPSLMDVVHEEGKPPNKLRRIVLRYITVVVIFVAFFIILFNLVMEWLAVAVDQSLLVVALVFYLLTIFRRHYRKFSPEAFIYKVGNAGEDFYDKFIKLFQSKSGIFLGVSGILVLHLLTDVGNFIIPYMMGLQEPVTYFGKLDPQLHLSLPSLYFKDISNLPNLIDWISITWIYIFNVSAMLFLLVMPAYIWYKLYKKQGFRISRIDLSVFFCSVAVFLLARVFWIQPVHSKEIDIAGVDVLTHTIKSSLPYWAVFLTSMLFALVVFIVSRKAFFKKSLLITGIVAIDLFFSVYIFYFFVDLVNYYVSTMAGLAQMHQFFIVFYFVMFLAVNICFYVGGFVIFLLETKKEFYYIH